MKGCQVCIPLNTWRLSSLTSFKDARSDQVNIESCNCKKDVPSETVNLTDNTLDEGGTSIVTRNVWVQTPEYTLTKTDYKKPRTGSSGDYDEEVASSISSRTRARARKRV